MFKQARYTLVSVTAAVLCWAAPLRAAPSQADISKEINLTTGAATSVIAGLQNKINGGSLAQPEVDIAALRAAFRESFKKNGGSDFEAAPDPQLGEIRKLFDEAFANVIEKYRADMLKGGQDAFVPAFFRAQLLEFFNKKSQGKYQAIVTTRGNELINRDSAPDKVIADKAVLEFVKGLLDKGEVEPQSKAIGERLVS